MYGHLFPSVCMCIGTFPFFNVTPVAFEFERKKHKSLLPLIKYEIDPLEERIAQVKPIFGAFMKIQAMVFLRFKFLSRNPKKKKLWKYSFKKAVTV